MPPRRAGARLRRPRAAGATPLDRAALERRPRTRRSPPPAGAPAAPTCELDLSHVADAVIKARESERVTGDAVMAVLAGARADLQAARAGRRRRRLAADPARSRTGSRARGHSRRCAPSSSARCTTPPSPAPSSRPCARSSRPSAPPAPAPRPPSAAPPGRRPRATTCAPPRGRAGRGRARPPPAAPPRKPTASSRRSRRPRARCVRCPARGRPRVRARASRRASPPAPPSRRRRSRRPGRRPLDRPPLHATTTWSATGFAPAGT